MEMSRVLQPTGGEALFNYRGCNYCCRLCSMQLSTAPVLLSSTLISIYERFMTLNASSNLSVLSFFPQVVLVFALSIGALGIYFIDSSE